MNFIKCVVCHGQGIAMLTMAEKPVTKVAVICPCTTHGVGIPQWHTFPASVLADPRPVVETDQERQFREADETLALSTLHTVGIYGGDKTVDQVRTDACIALSAMLYPVITRAKARLSRTNGKG